MRINAFIAAAAFLTGGALFAPAPLAAAADDTKMNGVYSYADEDGLTGTWIINTTCTPGCVAHVKTALDSGFHDDFVLTKIG
ncbi:MAG: hypothetical protein ABR885_08590 [Mycobacterium sp.]